MPLLLLLGSDAMPEDTADRPGVCTPWAGLGDLPNQVYGNDAAQLERTLLMASDILYDLTGRQWPGDCITTVRPCAAGARSDDAWWWPGRGTWPGTAAFTMDAASGLAVGDLRGQWGTCSCWSSGRCGCHQLDEVRLADRVQEILSVKIDGEVIPDTEYLLVDNRYLVGATATDGTRRCWPCCQHLDRPDTQGGTWSVQYRWGGVPPIGGVLACASLANELASGMGLLGDDASKKCRLPKRVTSVVRQNVAVAVLDPLTLFQDGRTGLPEIDLWVASVRKGRASRRGTVVAPSRRVQRLHRTD